MFEGDLLVGGAASDEPDDLRLGGGQAVPARGLPAGHRARAALAQALEPIADAGGVVLGLGLLVEPQGDLAWPLARPWEELPPVTPTRVE